MKFLMSKLLVTRTGVMGGVMGTCNQQQTALCQSVDEAFSRPFY